MKQISKLLLITTFFALAVSLMFVGTASAKYNGDGAVLNLTTGEWELPVRYCFGATTTSPNVDVSPADGVLDAMRIDISYANCEANEAAFVAGLTAQQCADNGYRAAYGGGCENDWTIDDPDTGQRATGYNGCLRCHNNIDGRIHDTTETDGDPSDAKENYMMTGHKNMLRKVTVGTPHLTPEGTEYTVDSSGNTFDWLMGTINVSGNDRDLLWIYGDWMDAVPHAIRSIYIDPTKNMSYSCSKCHATGTSVDSSLVTTKEPNLMLEERYGVGHGKIGTGNGQVKLNLSLAGYTSDTYASWDRWGIMCSRCHSSTDAGSNDTEREKWNPDIVGGPGLGRHHGPSGDLNNGAKVVRLCGECHRQEVSGQPYTFVGDINGTAWDKGFGDQAQTVLGGLSHGAPSPAVGHNYMNVFLNSPHARFSGTYGEIKTLANYDSTFMKADPDGLEEPGCTGCHNVHDSLAVDGHEPFENECTDCHSAASPDAFTPQVDIATINHLGGAGTPLEHVAENPNHACESCHMTGHGYHFMRINTDPSYVTKADYTVTGPDNAADDDGYASAVWLDLDIACGQCHGGGTNDVDNPPQAGLPYFTKAQLALVAEGIHDTAPVNYGVSFTLSATALTVDVDATVDCGGTCPGDLAYDWDWGDGEPNGTLDPDTHTYLSGGSKTITLTVSSAIAGGNVGSYSRSITLANPNGAPTAGASCVFDADTWTLAVTDTSTDDGPDADADADITPSLKIVVNWGDGSRKSKSTAGHLFEHTYNKAGIFSASLKASDNILQTDTVFCADVTTAYFTIAGEVHKSSGAALSSATVQLLDSKNRSKGTKLTSATGAFSFGSLKPGTYKLRVTKYGYTFPLTTVVIGPDSLGNVITALTP